MTARKLQRKCLESEPPRRIAGVVTVEGFVAAAMGLGAVGLAIPAVIVNLGVAPVPLVVGTLATLVVGAIVGGAVALPISAFLEYLTRNGSH